VGLVKILSHLNRGLDLAGNPLGPAMPLHIGVGANPGATDFEAEIGKFERKIEAGAEFCLTQPVYEPKYLERFLSAVSGSRIPVLVGILPLTSYRNAEFLHNEVPGMAVPAEVRELLKKAPSKERAQRVGIDIAAILPRAHLAEGAYLMPLQPLRARGAGDRGSSEMTLERKTNAGQGEGDGRD
jgi:homocysteine S-methyltransferase